MNLPELSIRRPVLATVLNLLIVVLGLIAYMGLTLREYPNTDAPVITVSTEYFGANAAIMESQVTKVLEDSLSGLEGLDYMSSVSRQENSQITVTFHLSRNADSAAADVRDRVSRARKQLPEDVEEPIISKVEADAQPIIYLSFSSDRHSDLEVSDYADRYVRDRLRSLPGVAQVNLFGDRRYAMRIALDPARLAAMKLAPADIEAAIRRHNLEVPAGRLESADREFTISGTTDLRTPEEFAAIVLREDKGYPLRLGDVAKIAEEAEEERSRVRFNGKPAVALGIVKQSVGNPIDVSRALNDVFPEIRRDLPEGMNVMTAYDSSVFIKFSIEKVFATIIEAILFVGLIIYFFLRRARAAIIPLVTIPISLVGAFAIMALLGFTVNTLTLLALVMAVGLVVDDAIVVLENIQRYIEAGEKPFAAALRGSREIVMAVVAMSITLAAVYTPVAFIGGNTGKLFTEFAITLAGTVLISGFVALTLTPTMCARLLRHEEPQESKGFLSKLVEGFNRFFDHLSAGYAASLTTILSMRRFIVGLAIGVALLGGVLYTFTAKELAPMEDRSFFMGVAIAPEGSSVAYLDGYTREMENIYRTLPDARHFFMVAGFPTVNQAISFVLLNPWEKRAVPAAAIVGSLFPRFMMLPGILAFPINPPSLGASARSQPVHVVLQSSLSFPELDAIVQKVLQAAMKKPGIVNLDSDLKLNKPEIQFTVRREKAAALGITIADIGGTLKTLFGGSRITRYKRGIDQYEVIVQLAREDRRTPTDLTSVYVRAASGEMVQLSDLVEVAEVAAPRELNHFDKFRAATLTASLIPGTSLGEALDFLEKEIKAAGGDKVRIAYGGQSREFKKSGAAMLVAFGLALIFIYLVLAAQYESVRAPLIILLTVPLALSGALATLFIVGGTINIYSQIGLITLIGLITKHGILIVEFAGHYRQQGADAFQAVMEAAKVRLRPIVMTTAATILGALPLALSHGAGAESRQQIGWVVVGGMAFGTLLTLYVLPCVYTYIAARAEKRQDEAHE